jgi:hypothetical protein
MVALVKERVAVLAVMMRFVAAYHERYYWKIFGG